MEKYKICRKCIEKKPVEDFSKSKRSKTGITSTCKNCHNAYLRKYRQKNRSKVREIASKYYAINREEILSYQKGYYEQNSKKKKNQMKENYKRKKANG